jgi:hypothetical protein
MSYRDRPRFPSIDSLAVLVALIAALLVRVGILKTVPW